MVGTGLWHRSSIVLKVTDTADHALLWEELRLQAEKSLMIILLTLELDNCIFVTVYISLSSVCVCVGERVND